MHLFPWKKKYPDQLCFQPSWHIKFLRTVPSFWEQYIILHKTLNPKPERDKEKFTDWDSWLQCHWQQLLCRLQYQQIHFLQVPKSGSNRKDYNWEKKTSASAFFILCSPSSSSLCTCCQVGVSCRSNSFAKKQISGVHKQTLWICMTVLQCKIPSYAFVLKKIVMEICLSLSPSHLLWFDFRNNI